MSSISQTDLVAALQNLLQGANTSIVQPQAGSPNNATNQMAVDVFTIPAGQQVIFNGTFTWFEIILTTADTIAVQAYQQGGQQNLYLGIEVVLDVPSNQMRFTNYGSASSTFSLMHGAGKQPAIDHRLIFNGADILNVTISNTTANPVPVVGAPAPVGHTGFGPITATGTVIAASGTNQIALRTLFVQFNGPVNFLINSSSGGYVMGGQVGSGGGDTQLVLPFPVILKAGDSLQCTITSGVAEIYGSFDYIA